MGKWIAALLMLLVSTSLNVEGWISSPLSLPAHEDRGWLSAKEQNCLSVVIYNEARSEPMEAQRAVAAVVINRAVQVGDVCKAAKAKNQFAYWQPAPKAQADKKAWLIAKALALEMSYTFVNVPKYATTATHFNSMSRHSRWGTYLGESGKMRFFT